MEITKKYQIFPFWAIVSIGILTLLYTVYNHHAVTIYEKMMTRARGLTEPLRHVIKNLGLDGPTTTTAKALKKSKQKIKWKTILFWSTWFGGNWSNRFGPSTSEELKELGCPYWQCNFTTDRSVFSTADAVITESGAFGSLSSRHQLKSMHQRWILVIVEAPGGRKPRNMTEQTTKWNPSFLVNWTMTYHRNTDVVAFYGHFSAINATRMPILPNMMSHYPETMRKYQRDVASGITLSDIMGTDWQRKLNKTKIVAWMSGHCPTTSRREAYVRELEKYMEVDTYGGCGKFKCGKRNVFVDNCWSDILARHSFYMAMENSLCDDYITEKLYLPMISYLVPVVWGGANYSLYLPPGSYIDARQYHPRDLAQLLTYLHNNPTEYQKYHLWRGYWQVHRGGSFCQMCHRLHTDMEEKHYFDIGNFRLLNGKCINAPKDMFTKKDQADNWNDFLQKYNSTL